MRLSKYLFLLVIGTMLPFGVVSAFESKVGDSVNLVETTRDDMYASGGNVRVDATIQGDLVVGGGDITIKSTVSQDILAAGGNIAITGPVGDDIRTAGGTMRVNNTVAGDVVAAGGQLHIDESAVIRRDLVFMGGQITIDGIIEGDAEIAAGDIIFGENGAILGDLSYTADRELHRIRKHVKGELEFMPVTINADAESMYSPSVYIWQMIWSIVCLFGLAAAIYFLFEKFWMDSVKVFPNNIGKSYLCGILACLLGWIPVIFILFFSIALGIWWFVSWLMFFIFLEELFLTIFGTAYLIANHKIKSSQQKILSLLMVATIVHMAMILFSMLPSSGPVVTKAIVFFGFFAPVMGCLLITEYRVCKAYLGGKIKIS